MKTITINNKEYPCRVTMGALLRFQRETGKDASQIGQNDVSDLITLLWCCVVSASKADGVSFPYGVLDFADRLDPDTLTGFFNEMEQEKTPSDPEKKTE